MFIDKKDFEEWMRRILERLAQLENRLVNPEPSTSRVHGVYSRCRGEAEGQFIERPRPKVDGERLLDNTDLCFMLSCSKRTLQRFRASGNLPYRRIEQKTYYLHSEVLHFIRNHLKPPTGEVGK